MRAWVLAAAAAILLAGCSDGGGQGPVAPGDPGNAEHGGAAPLPAPAWQVGHWWRLTSEGAGDFTHVVSADAGDDWSVDTDSATVAFFDARSDISFLGPVRKADLAGSQGSTRVEFFRFPLTLGANWTTTWDGEPIAIEVVALDEDGAELQGLRANGTRHVAYTYDARAGYFGRYAFYGPDGETVGFEARLADHGQGFAGDLVRWSLETEHEASGPLTPGAIGFDIDTGITDIWVDFHLACSAGGFSVHVGAATGIPQERGISASGPCPQQVDATFTLPPPAQDDEAWGSVTAVVPQATEATLDVTVLARTQALFRAGEAPAASA